MALIFRLTKGSALEQSELDGNFTHLRDNAQHTAGTIDGVAIGGTTPAAASVTQLTNNGVALLAGSGVPAGGLGVNGDFYFRSDGTVAGDTVIYHKEGGSWVATVTT